MDVDLISAQVTITASDDPVKTDLEVTCDHCGDWLCDVEAGDTFSALLFTADDHLRHCPKAGGVMAECGWNCGDPAPEHRHYSVLVRENGKLLGRLTPDGSCNKLKIHAWIMSRAKADEVAGRINGLANDLTAKVVPF